MDFDIYSSCLLRHMIAERLTVIERLMMRYERYSESHGVEEFYTKLSKLQFEKKKLKEIDGLLSDHIGKLVILNCSK